MKTEIATTGDTTMETKLPKFEATVEWLKEVMELRGLDSSFIEDGDCWEGLGKKKDFISPEFLAEVRRAIAVSGNGWVCYRYLLYIDKEDAEVRQALIDSRYGIACCDYLHHINREDKEMRQALIDSGEGHACYRYLQYVDKEDKEMRQVALAEGYSLSD